MKSLLSLTCFICTLTISNITYSQDYSEIKDKFYNDQNHSSMLGYTLKQTSNIDVTLGFSNKLKTSKTICSVNGYYTLILGKFLSSNELKQIKRLINRIGDPQYDMTPFFSDEDPLFSLV